MLFARATKTVWAIRILCEEGLGEDALVLGRSLLNLLIDFAYISAAESERRGTLWEKFEDVLAYELATRQQRAHEDELVEREYTEEEIAEYRAARDAAVREFFPWYDRGEYHRGWSGKTIRERARGADRRVVPEGRGHPGLEPEYELVYWALSGVEHSDVFGVASLIRVDGEGHVSVSAEPSPRHVIRAMRTALYAFHRVGLLTMLAFNLPEAQEMPNVDARVAELIRQAPPDKG
jgi:hypothetical protein